MEHSQYLSAIKKALKARGVTYLDLAEQLKMTESGVKKMLNAKDISFRRVLQICDCLGILPGQLFSLSERTSISEVILTTQQEEALLKNRGLLAVYWRIVIEKYEPHEIERLQHLTKAELKKILDRLVSLNLLTARKGVYRAKHVGKFKWSDKSKLASTLNKEWSELTLHRALSGKFDSSLHRLVSMKVSQESYQNLLKKLSKVLDEAVQDSESEELTLSKQELKTFTALIAVTPQGVFDTI
ncbi:helix-turn-helix domain-containing protein [uncultured Bdellovibrio sp.]|uniref:helix-turn-helix domain-containing protein n=1 Tax=Bdellovibrio sp. HCB-162 TaxID=3394234 RepID=UPI0025EF8DDE|nr:helix-turn-helix transcriptional regulator [uncultured Bdellovibrio sp.]